MWFLIVGGMGFILPLVISKIKVMADNEIGVWFKKNVVVRDKKYENNLFRALCFYHKSKGGRFPLNQMHLEEFEAKIRKPF